MGEVAVLKFGGSTLCDGDSIALACERILTQGHAQPVVVVSALQGVTDRLWAAFEEARSGGAGSQLGSDLRIRHRSVCHQLELPSDLLDRLWRELQSLLAKVGQQARAGGVSGHEARDQVLSFGERASARLVAAALRRAGVLATPVDSFDLGFETQALPGHSRLSPGVADRVRPALQQVPGIPVVTGFLAKDPSGNLTTLGRDGSDWTAAVLAQALQADELVYWKDVPGVLSADPRWLPAAQPIERLSLAEARELAFQGAQVLHSAALEEAIHEHTRVRIRCLAHGPEPGTILTPTETRQGAIAVASHRRLLGVEFEAPNAAGVQAKLSAAMVALSRHHQLARHIETSAQTGQLWLVDDESTRACLAALPPHRVVPEEWSSVALIGENLGQHPGLYRLVLQAFEEAAMPLHLAHFGRRQHGQAFIIERARWAEAMEICHSKVVGTPLRMAR